MEFLHLFPTPGATGLHVRNYGATGEYLFRSVVNRHLNFLPVQFFISHLFTLQFSYITISLIYIVIIFTELSNIF